MVIFITSTIIDLAAEEIEETAEVEAEQLEEADAVPGVQQVIEGEEPQEVSVGEAPQENEGL